MGKVVVASGKDLIQTKVRINQNWDEIDPKTKKVIKKADEGNYIPTPEELAGIPAKQDEPQSSGGIKGKIKSMIKNKLDKMIEESIDEVLSEI